MTKYLLALVLCLSLLDPQMMLRRAGRKAPAAGGVAAEFSDNFESGSLSAGWTSSAGTVNTWAAFGGISGPTGGGSYGDSLSGTALCDKDITPIDSLWVVMWVRVPAALAARVYIIGLDSNNTNRGSLMMSSTADADPPKLRWYLGGGTLGTNTLTYGKWYRIKLYAKITAPGSSTLTVWSDSLDGNGYTQQIALTNQNFGVLKFDGATMGGRGTGNTTHYDLFSIYTSNPDP